jgi:hypothetical protein
MFLICWAPGTPSACGGASTISFSAAATELLLGIAAHIHERQYRN